MVFVVWCVNDEKDQTENVQKVHVYLPIPTYSAYIPMYFIKTIKLQST